MILEANKSFYVSAMKRSGHHAILYWIFDSLHGPSIHLNDIKNQQWSSVTIKNAGFIKYKRSFSSLIYRRFIKGESRYTFVADDRRLNKNNLFNTKWQNAFFSVENDIAFSHRCRSTSRKNILVLRDPYNHFVSLKKSKMLNVDNFPKYRNLYLWFAERWLAGSDDIVTVNYNSWATDKSYRQLLAEEIGFCTDGRPFEDVPSFGGGSSFQGLKREREQNRGLDIEGRWKTMRNDRLLSKLEDDELIFSLSYEIFGHRIARILVD